MLKKLSWVGVLVLLVGCDTMYKTEYKALEIDSTLFTTVVPPKPPVKEEFLEASCPDQRKLLSIMVVEYQAALDKANDRIKAIEKIHNKNVESVDKMN